MYVHIHIYVLWIRTGVGRCLHDVNRERILELEGEAASRGPCRDQDKSATDRTLLPESQGQHLALTVLYVPSLLDTGPWSTTFSTVT